MVQAVQQPQQFGSFLLLARLGQGGMGAVYRARDTRSNRYVALKVMKSPGQDGDEMVERFRREANASIAIKHPNIVEGIEFGQASNGMWYFAMELMNGGDLTERIKRAGKLPEPEAIEIAKKIASGLAAAHERSLIHRDIKPENIMFAEGEPKISDMGLVKQVSGDAAALTAAGVAMGSPHYMAPELVQEAKDATAAVDVYALGCSIYEMITGHPVFPGNQPIDVMMKHMEMAIPSPAQTGECSPALALLLNQMTAKLAVDRVQNGAQVVAALDLIQQGKMPPGVAAPNATIMPPPGAPVAVSQNAQVAAQQQAMRMQTTGPRAGVPAKKASSGLMTTVVVIAVVVVTLLGAALLIKRYRPDIWQRFAPAATSVEFVLDPADEPNL